MNYTIIEFENANDEFIKADDLKKFISDAEIIISDYEDAWHKDFIKEVSEKHRGAALDLKDGMFTWGYNVKSKLVKAN